MDNNNPPFSVLITGASGVVGRAAAGTFVAQGHRVVGMTRGATGAALVRSAGALPVYADPLRAGEIKSMITMAKAEVVLNLAPQNLNQLPQRSADWEDAALLYSTTALLEAAKAAGVQFFVHSSYAFLYGDVHGEWVDESAKLRAPGDLPAFKAAIKVEELVKQSGIPYCILRGGFAYGAFSNALLSLREGMEKGRAGVVVSNEHVANWVHADDFAQAALIAARQRPQGEVFNLVDDRPDTTGAFVDAFADTLGFAHPARPALLPRQTSKEQNALLSISLKVKNDKAKSQLGWQPRYPSFHDGLAQVFLIWRSGEATPA
jgi:nucleoside-diphosphate-sugar epimerase